jgi:hypothetical protein
MGDLRPLFFKQLGGNCVSQIIRGILGIWLIPDYAYHKKALAGQVDGFGGEFLEVFV